MLKALVGSVLFLSSAGMAIAKPPVDFHREARPHVDHVLDRGNPYSYQHLVERARPNDAAGGSRQDARGAAGQLDRLTTAQKEKLCALAGVCVRSFHSDDVEDKTK